MRTHARKNRTAQQITAATAARPGQAFSGLSQVGGSILHLQRTIGNQAVQSMMTQANAEATDATQFSQGFSGIPIHGRSPIGVKSLADGNGTSTN